MLNNIYIKRERVVIIVMYVSSAIFANRVIFGVKSLVQQWHARCKPAAFAAFCLRVFGPKQRKTGPRTR